MGVFQQHFRMMQQALEADISQQEQQKITLYERREELQRINQQMEDDDNVKAIFLHNVTNRMIAPSESILNSVTRLCENYQDITPQEVQQETDNIKQQSVNIRELLSHKFNVTAPGTSPVRTQEGKEVNHE